MRLDALEIHNLRSIEAVTLQSFGSFNVLIGKNNSGKSNVLASIDHFFRFLSRQTLASRNSSLRSEVDHFDRRIDTPITIRATLSPGHPTLEALFSDIGEEFPQVRDALPDAGQHGQLVIEISFNSSPKNLAYISKIDFVSSGGSGERPLLQVPIKAAEEIASSEANLAVMERDSVVIETFADGLDSDDFERMKLRSRPAIPAIPARIREQLSPQQQKEILRVFESSRDVTDLRTTLKAQALSLRTRSDEVRSARLSNPLRTFAGETDIVPTYVSNLLSRVAESRILHLADRRRQIGSDEANRLLQLKMSRGGGETLRSIQQTVNSLLGVAIDAFASEKPSRRVPESTYRQPSSLPDAELDVDNFLVQVNGSGIREALRLVLDLEFEQPEILLVEEPEVHLHPALEIAMMRHLKAESLTTQVFLTTHSTNFLDTGDMQNVYMVWGNGSTQVQHLDVDAAESAIPKELGIRLSSIFMYDRLVFVEGITDELVLRAFAETLGLNLSQANVGFVIMGGSRNFTHYAAEATLAILSRRQVESIFILDRDEQRQSGLDWLARQLAEKADLHVLERREIENYLLTPTGMFSLLERKASQSGTRPPNLSKDTVMEVMAHEVEQLKGLSVAKRVVSTVCNVPRVNRARILDNWATEGLKESALDAITTLQNELDSVKAQLVDQIAEAEAEVDSRWATSKLDMVPGSELLDKIFRAYGFRYRKDRDSSELAILTPRSSIAHEISVLLDRMCSPR